MSSPRAGAAPVRAPTDPPTRQSHCIQAGSCNASRFKYYRVIIQLCDKLNLTHVYVSLYHVCIHFLIYPGTLLISSFEKSPLSHSALVVFIPSPTHFHPTICCSQLHTIAGVRLQKVLTGVPPKIALGVKKSQHCSGCKKIKASSWRSCTQPRPTFLGLYSSLLSIAEGQVPAQKIEGAGGFWVVTTHWRHYILAQ